MADRGMCRRPPAGRTAAVVALLVASIALAGCWQYVSKEAQDRLASRREPIAVAILPVRVVVGPRVVHDEALARRLAEALNRESLARADVAEAAVDIPLRWRANQARMARDSANALAERLAAAPVKADYALLVEILCNAAETEVIGVHFYLAEAKGLVAAGGLGNSHRPDFQEVRPKDRDGGLEIALRMIRRGLQGD